MREDRAVSAITILGCKEYKVFRCGESQKELIVRKWVCWDKQVVLGSEFLTALAKKSSISLD
jgi:hypothetical protein